MAAPILTSITLPVDTGNTGKKVQTQSELVGSDTVHAHYFVSRSRRKLTGIYYFGLNLQSVQNIAQVPTANGFFWLQVPTGATVRTRLRKLEVVYTLVAEIDQLTAPRVVLARFTFTGTASGVVASICKRNSTDATNVSDVRTTVTGMVVVPGNIGWVTLVPAFGLSTQGSQFATSAYYKLSSDDEEDFIDLSPGEGLVLYQPDTGTVTDARRFMVTGVFDEYDNA